MYNENKSEKYMLFQRSDVFIMEPQKTSGKNVPIKGNFCIIEDDSGGVGGSISIEWIPNDSTIKGKIWYSEDLRSMQYVSHKGHNQSMWFFLILMNADGSTSAPIEFHEPCFDQLKEVLSQFMSINRSPNGSNLYLIRPFDEVALRQSFDQFDLFPDSRDQRKHSFIRGGFSNFSQITSGVNKYIKLLSSDSREVASVIKGDYKDLVIPQKSQPGKERDTQNDILHAMATAHKPSGSILSSITTSAIDDGYEVVTQRNKTISLPPLKSVTRTKPVTQSMWDLYVCPSDGHIINKDQLCQNIFRGGLEDPVRPLAWKYILGFYEWEKSLEENLVLEQGLRKEYEIMKTQWQSITPQQEEFNSVFRERKSLVEKDVHRTDRTTDFFAEADGNNLKMLNNILLTYTVYNFDLGYVQGMNDILAPILINIGDEPSAFWCFERCMQALVPNFEREQAGMKKSFSVIHAILEVIDWEFYKYLTEAECGSMFFCFRWLLVCFKREFCYTDVMRLWEVAWSGTKVLGLKSHSAFFVLVSCGLLLSQRSAIMSNKYGFNEILKHVNDLAYHFELESLLVRVEQIHAQLVALRSDLSIEVVQFLGL